MKTEIIVNMGPYEHIMCNDTDDDLEELVGTYHKLKELSQIPTEGGESKHSFNEEGQKINFDPVRHTYFHEDKKLESATGYIKKFYKPFDAPMIAGVCAKSWKVGADDIQSMWSSNGDLSSAFGTVVHNALEHYDKYRALALDIESNTEGKKVDVAMPKHPFLKGIIEGFAELDDGQGEVVPEALITDVKGGYCGHSDRVLILDKDKKVCRIQDYKVNVDAEVEDKNLKPSAPFASLPATKLTKYQLQMSFYANMLQKSGWTVEGLDAFVYEGEWKHYELEVLNLI